MDQNTIFWNNILQLKQLKKLALNFQKIKQIQLNYLKNLFYAISVLIQLESLTLTFPHCAFEESTVSYKTLILPLIRLVKIKELLLSFSWYRPRLPSHAPRVLIGFKGSNRLGGL